jgi:hypothetical protein
LRLLMATHVVRFIEEEFPYEINKQLELKLKNRYVELVNALSKNEIELHSSVQRHLKPSELLNAQLEVQKFERALLNQLHKDGAFDQSVIRRIEQELDIFKLQFDRAHKRKKK